MESAKTNLQIIDLNAHDRQRDRRIASRPQTARLPAFPQVTDPMHNRLEDPDHRAGEQP